MMQMLGSLNKTTATPADSIDDLLMAISLDSRAGFPFDLTAAIPVMERYFVAGTILNLKGNPPLLKLIMEAPGAVFIVPEAAASGAGALHAVVGLEDPEELPEWVARWCGSLIKPTACVLAGVHRGRGLVAAPLHQYIV